MVQKVSKRIDLTEDAMFSGWDPNRINFLSSETMTRLMSERELITEREFYRSIKEEMDIFNLDCEEKFNCHRCGKMLYLRTYDICDKCDEEMKLEERPN